MIYYACSTMKIAKYSWSEAFQQTTSIFRFVTITAVSQPVPRFLPFSAGAVAIAEPGQV